jgi:hypothetical protein
MCVWIWVVSEGPNMHIHIHMRAGFLIIFIRVSPGETSKPGLKYSFTLTRCATEQNTPKQQYNSNGMVGSWLMGGAAAPAGRPRVQNRGHLGVRIAGSLLP